MEMHFAGRYKRYVDILLSNILNAHSSLEAIQHKLLPLNLMRF